MNSSLLTQPEKKQYFLFGMSDIRVIKSLGFVFGILVLPVTKAEMQPIPSTWTGEAEVGVISTTGNTKTETVNANGKISTDQVRWRFLAQMFARNTADDTGTTAERYELKMKSSYKVVNLNYLYAQINYENDRFSDYEYILTESLGFGRRIIDNNDMKLDLEMGPGLRQRNRVTGKYENDPIISASGLYAWKFSTTSKLSEDFSVQSGDDATISKSVTSITTQMGGSLAMKISYTAKRTSKVPSDTANYESESAITLVHSFGL